MSFLRARVPEGAPEPEPVPEVPAEPVPGAATEPEAPSSRVKPLPAYAEAEVAGLPGDGQASGDRLRRVRRLDAVESGASDG